MSSHATKPLAWEYEKGDVATYTHAQSVCHVHAIAKTQEDVLLCDFSISLFLSLPFPHLPPVFIVVPSTDVRFPDA